MKQPESNSFFRFLFIVNNSTKIQREGLPNSVQKWELNGGGKRKNSFTSAFKKSIKAGEISVHDGGLGIIKKQLVTKTKVKMKIK